FCHSGPKVAPHAQLPQVGRRRHRADGSRGKTEMLRERPAVVFEMSGPTTGRPGSRAAGEIVHDVHRPRTTAPGDRMALPPGRPGPGRSRPGLRASALTRGGA